MVNTLNDRRGFALESTLIMMVLLLALVSAAVTTTVMIQKTSNVDYRSGRVQYAAEAGADALMDQLQTATQDGLLTDAELAALTPPNIPGFTYPSITTWRDPNVVQETIETGNYKGLYGLNQRVDVNVNARDASNNHANVIVSLNVQTIPLFQFGVFFNNDLEIHNGPRLDFAGWVHTNGNLYIGSDGGSYYHDMVTTPKKVFRRRKTTAQAAVNSLGAYIDDETGTSRQLNFDSQDTPNAASFRSKSANLVDDRLKTDAYALNALTLPLPGGLDPITIVQPKNAADAVETQAVKYAWLADFVVTVDLNVNPAGAADAPSTDLCSKIGVGFGAPTPVGISRNGTGKNLGMTAAQCNNIFQFQRNAFNEGREGYGVDVLNVNVGNFMDWLELDPANRMLTFGGGLGSIVYINFRNAWDRNGGVAWSAATDNIRDFPAVRLYNGYRLKYKLTVATDRPVYVWSNYNAEGPVGGWRASAIIGDAVTFLSPDWVDANRPWPTTAQCAGLSPTGNPPEYRAGGGWNAGTCNSTTGSNVEAAFTLGAGQVPVGTTNTMIVKAAILAGGSPTGTPTGDGSAPVDCSPAVTTCAGPYGGGLENFPRFLENWGGGGRTLLYSGSLVSLFYSRYSNIRGWAWRPYYGAPTRDWSFDTRFADPMNLPPGTPMVTTITPTSFRPVY